MPVTTSIEISDEALPVVRAALDERNDYQRRANYPEFTLESFLQQMIVDRFGIAPDALKSREREKAKSALMVKVEALTIEKIAELAETLKVDAAVDPIAEPVEPIVP